MDRGTIDKSAANLIEIAELAGLGIVEWAEFTRALATIFPGCMSVFMQNNDLSPNLSLFAHYGVEQIHIDQYMQHFAAINPWNRFWQAAAIGSVFRSSQVMPAKSFEKSEFYNDWLARIDRRHDGIGMKLRPAKEIPIVLSMQLPDSVLQQAEAVLEPVLLRLSGVLVRSVATSYLLRTHRQKALAVAAIIEREPEMAFAIDDRLRIIEANDSANRSLSNAALAVSHHGILRLKSDRAQTWLQTAVRQLGGRHHLPDHRFVFSHLGLNYRMSVARIPEYDPNGANGFLAPRHLNLLIIRNLEQPLRPLDVSALSQIYALTPSEVRMCEALFENLTLSECADRLGITRETARERLKQIFHKAGVRRQSELIALLGRLG